MTGSVAIPMGGPLPEAGGWLDQAAATMTSLAIIDRAYEEWRAAMGQ